MIDNILTVLDGATDEQRAGGLSWYFTANDLAVEIADGNARMGAGVIAALSPMMSWDRNVLLARQAFADGQASGCLNRNRDKANRIMAGEDPALVLGGDKVRSFFDNIADPINSRAVTIDRHAYDVATGARNTENNRPGLTGKRYAGLAEAYRDAAIVADLLPHQVQAITWEAWRTTWAWRRTPLAVKVG